jgi:hypothetical protein
LIKASATDPELFSLLDTASNALKVSTDNVRTITKIVRKIGGSKAKKFIPLNSLRITRFSDHVAVSAPLFGRSSLFQVHSATLMLIRGLLIHGRCCRGALVFGDLRHGADTIFGPALIEAHDIESRVAKYPRIVLSDGAQRLISMYHPDIPIRQDRDSLWYLDILGPYDGDIGLADEMLDGVQRIFERQHNTYKNKLLEQRGRYLTGPQDLDVQAKLGWLVDYIRSVPRSGKRTKAVRGGGQKALNKILATVRKQRG